ncbi:MAG: zinc dependent phospholipase C family protein [Candidatus Bathyarchaeota archaeon]|nr:zinc dependent phospholipase C family protein [Candidatus Bathyarchaeota archaeon]
MLIKQAKVACAWVFLNVLLIGVFSSPAVSGWSNGGYSADPAHPDYGTHDWIAEHALDWLPQQEKQFLLDNKASFLYGTELPDNSQAPDGIGDITKHHIYFSAAASVQDDASAERARDEYAKAVSAYAAGDHAEAAKQLGIVTHYIADMAVFGHVMAASIPWGAETHHSDYETYVQDRTKSYTSEFNSFLAFDGSLNTVAAYDAALLLANDTTFDLDGDLTCVWMDQHYDWGDAAFRSRLFESLNLAVNLVADVLHSFYSEAVIPEFPAGFLLPLLVIATLSTVAAVKGLTKKRILKQLQTTAQ